MSYDTARPPMRLSVNDEQRLLEFKGLAITLPRIRPTSFDKLEWILLTPPAEIAAAHVAAIALVP